MLGNFKTSTSFSAPDLTVAKDFYANKLGIEVLMEIEGVLVFKTGGDTQFMVYLKPNHKAAEYTVLNFDVDNLEETVKELNAKGVMMEQYPDMGTNELGISGDENQKMAWFKDPAGNIVGLMQNK